MNKEYFTGTSSGSMTGQTPIHSSLSATPFEAPMQSDNDKNVACLIILVNQRGQGIDSKSTGRLFHQPRPQNRQRAVENTSKPSLSELFKQLLLLLIAQLKEQKGTQGQNLSKSDKVSNNSSGDLTKQLIATVLLLILEMLGANKEQSGSQAENTPGQADNLNGNTIISEEKISPSKMSSGVLQDFVSI